MTSENVPPPLCCPGTPKKWSSIYLSIPQSYSSKILSLCRQTSWRIFHVGFIQELRIVLETARRPKRTVHVIYNVPPPIYKHSGTSQDLIEQ